jgi:hypothetical protein
MIDGIPVSTAAGETVGSDLRREAQPSPDHTQRAAAFALHPENAIDERLQQRLPLVTAQNYQAGMRVERSTARDITGTQRKRPPNGVY